MQSMKISIYTFLPPPISHQLFPAPFHSVFVPSQLLLDPDVAFALFRFLPAGVLSRFLAGVLSFFK